jgi:hypothetical protein
MFARQDSFMNIRYKDGSLKYLFDNMEMLAVFAIFAAQNQYHTCNLPCSPKNYGFPRPIGHCPMDCWRWVAT